jgi:hypothetical protein
LALAGICCGLGERTPARARSWCRSAESATEPEKLGIQIRAEAYNAFNHTNLLFPATTLAVVANPATQAAVFSSPGYGLITSARSARFM